MTINTNILNGSANLLVQSFKKYIDNCIANTEYSHDDISKFWCRISLHGRRFNRIDCLYSSLSIEIFDNYNNPIIDCNTSKDSNIARHNSKVGIALSLVKKYNKSFAKTDYYIKKLQALECNTVELEI